MTAVSDDFNRANGGLGANWSTASGSWSISSNAAVPAGGSTFSVAGYNTAIGNGSQAIYCQATVTADMSDTFNYPGVGLSESASSYADSYFASFGPSFDSSIVYLTRRIGGSSTDIALGSWSRTDSAVVLRIEWDPATNTIRAFAAGVEISWSSGSNVDTNIQPTHGMMHYFSGNSSGTFDNFAGDTLGAAAATSLLAPRRIDRFRPLLVR